MSTNCEIEKLLTDKLELESQGLSHLPTIYHIDIAYEVYKNVDNYLFSLIFACYLKHSNGLVWRRNAKQDFYLIEITPPIIKTNNIQKQICIHSMINLLPTIEFRTPRTYLNDIRNVHDDQSELYDNLFRHVYKSEEYQRVCFYIRQVNEYRTRTSRNLTTQTKSQFLQEAPLNEEAELELVKLYEGDKNSFDEFTILETIMTNSELIDPSWHEIRNYVTFLNSQLVLYEKGKILDSIKGLRGLCLHLILVVAINFGSPSLNYTTEQFVQEGNLNQRGFQRQESINVFEFRQDSLQPQISLQCYEIRDDRKWENLVHPFMILNSDCSSVTFIGTHVDRPTKQFINPNTRKPLSEKNPKIPSIAHSLFIELLRQRYPLFDNFNDIYREKNSLSYVM